MHFKDFFFRYINVIVNKKSVESDLSEDDRKLYRRNLTKFKKDLLSNTDKCSNEYDDLKQKLRNGIFSVFRSEKNFYYQVKEQPTKFIPMLIKMSLEIESMGEKNFNVFPLRKNNVPKYY